MTDKQLFGYGIELVDGDVKFTLDESGLAGLRTIAGRANLVQALTLRIMTPFGSDRFNTGYGLDLTRAFTEPGSLRSVKDVLRLSLVATLASDARIRDVTQIFFGDDPLLLASHPEIDPAAASDEVRRGRVWHAEVTLETVKGETVVLPVMVGA